MVRHTMKSIGLGLLFTLIMNSVAFGFAVYGAIGEKYVKLGSERGPLGAPLSDEAPASFGGRFNNFQYGFIYWHPQIGAFAVWGAIGEKWNEFGRVTFGYPITDELATPDGRGRFNHFRKIHEPGKPETSIYWTPQTGAHVVYGEIRKAWANQGWERGRLGYPTSDEFQDGRYRRSNFENGFITWSAEGGAVIKNKPSYTCAHCNDGSCQCGDGTPDQLCANHNGNDPEIGCSQQE